MASSSEYPVVRELEDDDEILALLSTQRSWSAYALCDLEAPHRQYARYIGAVRNGRVTALVLVYCPPSFTSLQPCGDPGDVSMILSQAPRLPVRPTLITQRSALPGVETRYRLDRMWTMHRMVVTAGHFVVPSLASAEIVRLSVTDLPAVQHFYSGWLDTVFVPSMLEADGVYFGAIRDGDLVAVAGTHAVSTRHCLAMIGNVYTHPKYRGQGFATAVTGAVVEGLFAAGIRDVALNVREDNASARHAYSRLGFVLTEPFWEGEGTLR